MNTDFLDHDMVLDTHGSVYQVIGNEHPPGLVYAVKKYVVSPWKTPWGRTGYSFTRLVREYSPDVSRLGEKHYYDPGRKSFFPALPRTLIRRHYVPVEGADRIFRRASDRLETIALGILKDLVDAGARPQDLGVTGSILLGIHNEEISDIDIVVYDCRYLRLVEEAGIIHPYKGEALEWWVRKNSVRLRIPPLTVAKLYDWRKRGSRGGRNVTIVPVDKNPQHERTTARGEYLGTLTAMIRAKTRGCQHEYYPRIAEGEVESIIEPRLNLDGSKAKIISYEALFLNNLQDEQRLMIRGKSYYDRETDTLTMIIGIREAPTYAKIL